MTTNKGAINAIDWKQYYAAMPESELQRRIKALAEAYGWLYYHATDSRKDPRGFPDVVLVRGGRVIFAELKSEKGRLRPEQKLWETALTAGNNDVYLWRPSHLPQIEKILSKKQEATV